MTPQTGREMTKDQCTALIERLADKTLSLGCKFTTKSIFNPDQEHTVVDIEMNYEGDRELLPPFEEVTDEDGIVYPVTKIKNIIGHPVKIGDVLEKMKGEGEEVRSLGAIEYDILDLVQYWQPCGFSKSLFEILEESEWEECNGERWHWECNRDCQLWMLKSPAKELFLFLDQLFPA